MKASQASRCACSELNSWQHDLEVSLRLLAQDYDETADDLEIGASEIRHPELLPAGKRPFQEAKIHCPVSAYRATARRAASGEGRSGAGLGEL